MRIRIHTSRTRHRIRIPLRKDMGNPNRMDQPHRMGMGMLMAHHKRIRMPSQTRRSTRCMAGLRSIARVVA